MSRVGKGLKTGRRLHELPLGAEAWTRHGTRTLSPLIGPQGELKVRRCGPDALSAGDLVLVRAHGKFDARLVTAVNPLSLAPLFEAEQGGGEVVAKVLGLRRGQREVPVSVLGRQLLRGLHLAGRQAKRNGWARRLYREVKGLLSSKSTAPVRRRAVGALSIRTLRPEDASELIRFGAALLPAPSSFLDRQVKGRWQEGGVAVGAFDVNDRLRGFAYLDEYREEGLDLPGHWVRSLMVWPTARRLGVGEALIARLLEEAEGRRVLTVFADIHADNDSSRALFAKLGFVPSDAALHEKVTAEWERQDVKTTWAVVERRLGRAAK